LTIHGKRHIRHIGRILLFLPVIVILSSSCSSTKHVPDDRYLLDAYNMEVDNVLIDKAELKNYIKPKPNKKILGMKFYLALYNLSKKDKDNGFNRWLRNIGEEPIIYDQYDTEKNSKQIKLYLKNKGYYFAEVTDSVRLRKKKARVDYDLKTGEPFIINNIAYNFEDTTIMSLVLDDTVNSVVAKGDVFDVDLLLQERNRIEKKLKQSGYFNFNRDYVYFRVDTARDDLLVDLNVEIKKYLHRSSAGQYIQVPHRKYKINRVLVFLDYDPRLALSDPLAYQSGLDSVSFDDISFLYDEELRTSPTVIAQSIFVLPGAQYNLDDVEQSRNHLSNLRVFKMVNIEFTETDTAQQYAKEIYNLDCHVYLSPMTTQNYTVELTGTNSSGNFGVAGNLNYQHRNLFGGAENFNFRIKGALEALRQSDYGGFDNMLEFGAESRITFPKFILPFKHESFIKKYNPKTNFTIAYNFQRRPDYTRTVANASFGYIWRGNQFTTHLVNPIEINLVKLPKSTTEFDSLINGTYLQHSFEDKLIQAMSYSFIFNNQDINKLENFVYFRINLESSGLLLSSGSGLVSTSNDFGRYELLGTEFSQYLKSDLDLRYYTIIDDHSSLAYRLFMGTAYPYGNSIAIPFEKQYFTGGANGIRAWQVRDLGPGSYMEPEDRQSKYPNKTGDIKLEGNLEYRFKLFWLLEGALFVDAGNIWAISTEDALEDPLFEDARFGWDKFYKEIAIGTGFGVRMDFDFFIFRLDLGIKVRDPQGDWRVMTSKQFDDKAYQLNLAIGYPF